MLQYDFIPNKFGSKTTVPVDDDFFVALKFMATLNGPEQVSLAFQDRNRRLAAAAACGSRGCSVL